MGIWLGNDQNKAHAGFQRPVDCRRYERHHPRLRPGAG